MEKIFPIAMARSAFLPGLATQTHGSSGRSAALCARLCNHVPSLRERREDIPLLVAFLVQTFAQKLGKSVTQVFEGTLRRLVEYSWPGNVRELQNVIERGVILSPSNLLVLDREFSLAGDEARAATVAESLESIISGASSLPGTSLREAERRHIESALAATNWAIEGEKGAARILDVHPNTLRSRMKKLNIQRPGEAPTNGEPAYGDKSPFLEETGSGL